MSTPLPEPSSRTPELDRVARKWAQLVSLTSYIPLPHKDLVRQLRGMAQDVFDAAASEPFDADLATGVGERLVKLYCVGRTSLRCSTEVLTQALLADERLRRTDGSGARVARTLGAVACGYADALRWHIAEQQDRLNQALLHAARQAEQSVRDRAAECDEVLTELSLLRNQLNHQLLHDVLTALPNRQYFTTRLEHVLNTGGPTSVYHLEINGMAAVLGGLGQQAFTVLLRIVGQRLRAVAARHDAMVARLEMGRFALLVESKAPAADPAPLVEEINAALAEPVPVDGFTMIVSASTGVVQSPPYGRDPIAVLDAANLAQRKANRLGPGRWALLEPGQHGDDRQELRLAAALPGAWRDGQVHVVFRQQFRLADRRPAGAEALLRWEHPELGSLPHERCAELAEQTGLGARLGRWLLDRADERLRSWRSDLPLTVNALPSQATDPLLPTTVDRSDLSTARLRVSVPAGLATGAAADNLAHLAAAGVSVAVHDFGGTAGDMTCLTDTPVHVVRLAPALVRRSADRVIGQALRNMVALVHDAGATVAVDDVRTEVEAGWWRDTGADIATGPLFDTAAHA